MRVAGRILVAWVPTLVWFWIARGISERVLIFVSSYTMPVGGMTLTYVAMVALYLASFLLVFEAGTALGHWLWPRYKIKRGR
jgi:hypothetical protein